MSFSCRMIASGSIKTEMKAEEEEDDGMEGGQEEDQELDPLSLSPSQSPQDRLGNLIHTVHNTVPFPCL